MKKNLKEKTIREYARPCMHRLQLENILQNNCGLWSQQPIISLYNHRGRWTKFILGDLGLANPSKSSTWGFPNENAPSRSYSSNEVALLTYMTSSGCEFITWWQPTWNHLNTSELLLQNNLLEQYMKPRSLQISGDSFGRSTTVPRTKDDEHHDPNNL